MSARNRIGPGVSIVIGIIATLTLGIVGAFGWLLWVWSQTPDDVRANVSTTKRAAVIAFASVCVAMFALGLVMTVIELRLAFVHVNAVDPANKARMLAEAISSAMNWTVVGMLPLPVAVIVVFVAGYKLLRATHE
jgi:hypothetical protein